MCHLILFPLSFSFLHPLIFLIIVFIPDFIFAFVGLVVLCCHDVYILAISLWLSYFGLVRFFVLCVCIACVFFRILLCGREPIPSMIQLVPRRTRYIPAAWGFWLSQVLVYWGLMSWGFDTLGSWHLGVLISLVSCGFPGYQDPRYQDTKMPRSQDELCHLFSHIHWALVCL